MGPTKTTRVLARFLDVEGRKPKTGTSYELALARLSLALTGRRIRDRSMASAAVADVLLTSRVGDLEVALAAFNKDARSSKDASYSVATKANSLRITGYFLQFAKESGLISEIPNIEIPKIRAYENASPARTDDFQRALAWLEHHDSQWRARTLVLLHLAGTLGMRTAEISRLEIVDIDVDRQRIELAAQIVGASGRDEQSLEERVMDAVLRWMKHRGPGRGPLLTPIDESGVTSREPLSTRQLQRDLASVVQRAETGPLTLRGLRQRAIANAGSRAASVARLRHAHEGYLQTIKRASAAADEGPGTNATAKRSPDLCE